MPTIQHLPPELLSIIFNYVNTLYRDATSSIDDSMQIFKRASPWGDADDLWKRTYARNDLMKLSETPELLFPFNLANVSGTWRNVLASHPEFWGRVFLYIDKTPSTVQQLADYLKWSGSQPLDVVITRRPPPRPKSFLDFLMNSCDPVWDGIKALRERDAVQEFLGLLQPHLGRCRSISIDTTFSSSLPCLGADFRGEAKALVSLSLQCRVDDIEQIGDMGWEDRVYLRRERINKNEKEGEEDVSDEESGSESSEEGEIEDPFTPKLRMLDLDGRNLYWECSRSPTWSRGTQTKLEELTISHYSGSNAKLAKRRRDGLSVRQMLQLFDFGRLRYLHLRDLEGLSVEEHEDDEDINELERESLERLQDLTFEQIEGTVITEVLRVAYLPSVRIARFMSGGFPSRAADAWNYFETHPEAVFISHPSTVADLLGFMTAWHGSALCLEGISVMEGNDDELYKVLGTEVTPKDIYSWHDADSPEDTPEATGGKYFPCVNLQILALKFCAIEDVENLRTMVENRSHYVNYDDADWKSNTSFGPALSKIVVRTAMDIEEEDLAWFDSKVPEFSILPM